MLNPVLFSSKTPVWETPQALFDELDREFHFETDVCALPENAKCKRFFTPEMDGLKQEWTGVCWCNPPYGRVIADWVKKAAESKATTVMLLPNRTEMGWFHEYVLGKAEVRPRTVPGTTSGNIVKVSAVFVIAERCLTFA